MKSHFENKYKIASTLRIAGGLLLATVFLGSCEQVIDLEIPPHEPQIVLNAFLIAGDSFPEGTNQDRVTFVNVSESKSSLDRERVSDIKDANVRLFANGSLVETVNRGEAFAVNYDWDWWGGQSDPDSVYQYPISYVVQPETTYRLEAQKSGFKNDLVFAVQTTPAKPVVENVALDQNDNTSILSFDLVDPASQGDLYIVRLFEQFNAGSSLNSIWFNCLDPNFSGLSWVDEFGDIGGGEINVTYQGIIRDDAINGTRRRFELRLEFAEINPQTSYALEITSVTPEFEKYLRGYYLNEIAADNPFAEPVQLFYNVQNGYGAVLAGTRTIKFTD